PTEIQKAIQEIEAELNREPKIIENEFESNWRTYLRNSANFIQLESRKQEILDNIQEIRGQEEPKELSQLRQGIIQKILNELAKSPPIEDEELNEPNWEEEINALSK